MQETCNHVVSCDFQSHETVCFFCLFYTEEPFYLKEVYLPTGCSDCVLAHEEVISGNDTFTSLLLFSKKHTSHYTMCESRTLFFFLLLFFEAWKSVEKPLATPPPLFFLCSLFPGRKMSVSPDVVETLKKEAECLRMSSPIMMDPNNGESFSTFLNKLCHYYVIKVVCLFFYLYSLHTQKSALTTSRPQRGSVSSTAY